MAAGNQSLSPCPSLFSRPAGQPHRPHHVRSLRRPALLTLALILSGLAAAPAAAQCDAWHAGPLNSTGGAIVIDAFVPFAGRLIGGGTFQSATSTITPASNIASWDGVNLTPLGTGMNGEVLALTSYTTFNIFNILIAGGSFTTAGGVAANRVAVWSESNVTGTPAWSPLGAGFSNGQVNAVERYNSSLYAAGTFTLSNGVTVNRIARWDGTNWVQVGAGGGLNGTANALKVYNGQLYAGGAFTTAAGVATGGLARWDGSVWSSVGGFFGGTVLALDIYNGSLVIGGLFTGFGGSPNISTYNSVSGVYTNLGTGGTVGVSSRVKSLAVNGPNLYIGGDFQMSAGGVPASYIAKWNGSAWSNVRGGTSGSVLALESYRGEVDAGGIFFSAGTGAGNVQTSGWARYSETEVPWFVRGPGFVGPACRGGSASFTATIATGFPTATLRWRKGGVPLNNGLTPAGSTIIGATTGTLTINGLTPSDAGSYDLTATTPCGTATSSPGTLSLCVADWNCDGEVNGNDISDYINSWYFDIIHGTVFADANADGETNGNDISDYINLWYAAIQAGGTC